MKINFLSKTSKMNINVAKFVKKNDCYKYFLKIFENKCKNMFL